MAMKRTTEAAHGATARLMRKYADVLLSLTDESSIPDILEEPYILISAVRSIAYQMQGTAEAAQDELRAAKRRQTRGKEA